MNEFIAIHRRQALRGSQLRNLLIALKEVLKVPIQSLFLVKTFQDAAELHIGLMALVSNTSGRVQ
ncbi:hypothetical protein [Rhodohalobacter mucosus]|uniref:hypothetical protein n=1 Tax=Rhodohalobacter mucosus TaxID=2079485 RepID=UPI0011B26888|nr:hypothetical protein [Rhodohalobacter mucosus]